MIEKPAPTEDEKHLELIGVMETRRAQADSFAWTGPGLALASQAILLTIAFDSATSPWVKLLVALFGLAIVLAIAHFLAKQVFAFNLFESVIEEHRDRVGLHPVHRDALVQSMVTAAKDREAGEKPERPVGTQFRKRWVTGLNDVGKPHLHWTIRIKQVHVWAAAFAVMAVIDLGLVVWAIADLVGDDCSRHCR